MYPAPKHEKAVMDIEASTTPNSQFVPMAEL
jgi:hypothetical protein